MAYSGYTQTDLESVSTAIIALSTGKRIVEATIRGRTVRYSEVDLEKLRALRSEISAEVSAAAGKSGLLVLGTGKGI